MSGIQIGITAAVVAVVFGILWYQGQVRRFAVFVQATREELKKCSWPTWDELKGSTAVIIVSIIMLAVFCVAADEFLSVLFFKILKI